MRLILIKSNNTRLINLYREFGFAEGWELALSDHVDMDEWGDYELALYDEAVNLSEESEDKLSRVYALNARSGWLCGKAYLQQGKNNYRGRKPKRNSKTLLRMIRKLEP